MITVEDIAKLLRGKIDGDARREVHGVASLDTAQAGEIAYAEGERALTQAERSGAACILVPEGITIQGRTTVTVKHPKLALIKVAEALHPPTRYAPGIHPTAIVALDAEIAPDASVGAYAVIGARATIGAMTRIAEGVTVGEGVEIGSSCMLYPRVTIYPGSRLGDRVVLHAGVVIGSDGFGYVFADGHHHKFPQLGKVLIKSDVEIGANSVVDRGSLGTTVIGEGTKIDNLVQIAHNVRIGRHTVIAAQTGISGSAEIGDYVVIAGQVGIGERARIEDRAVVGGQAGILPGKVVRAGSVVWGTPARPLAEFKRLHAVWSRLPEWVEKLRKL